MSPSRKPSPSAVVGLDIGSDSIKVAEAKKTKDGIAITALGMARIPEGVVENEVIVDPKALGSAIKALLVENGIKTKKSVSSVAGQSRVVVRVIEVPKMSGKELAETIKWEVERHVPFPPNEIVMDYQPVERPSADPNAQNMEVLLAVAQQELIDSHVQALAAAGLKPMAIDIESLAASRALVETSTSGAKNEVVAIVNIGANNTDLGIFENGILTFPSPPLGIAGSTFTQEIAEGLGQTPDQAEITKKEYAAVNLDAFPDTGASDDMGGGFSFGSEPTSFGTSVGPEDAAGGTAFDLGGSDSDASGAASEPIQPGGFTNTIDGPDFGSDDPLSGITFGTPQPAGESVPPPAFDLGGGESTVGGPAFDFGSDEPQGESQAFDLGGGEPGAQQVKPSFDLDDEDDAPSMEPENVDPNFDLSDINQSADPGDEVLVPVPAAKTHESGSMEEKVFQSISGALTDLAVELRRSLDYYGTKYANPPQRIFLCGGTAKMPKLDEFLSRELGIPCEVADPVKNLQVNVPAASPQYIKDISPLFSVCIGLAIRDMIG
ncbi:MAG: type IV pilus assembly protein PilM [Armatimonadota bacterium]|nr:type IV pilus assembly protein PilM [bacterium]